MKQSSFRSISGWPIALGFIAFLGAAHILIRTFIYGVEHHNDAGVYIFDAEVLATGKILESGGLLWSPPLFAAVLSFYRLLGVEPSDVGRFFNIIGFGLIILVVGHWLHRTLKLRIVVICAVISIAISYPLVRISSQLLSEILFILMILFALIRLEYFLSERKIKSDFWMLILFSALALLTRWMGVTVVLTGALLILISRGTSANIKWKQTAIYSVASSLPAVLWMLRNWIVNGTLTSREVECVTKQSLWDSLRQFGDQLHLWVFVRHSLGWLDVCLWAMVALAGFEAAKALTNRSISASERKNTFFQKVGSLLDTKKQPVMPIAAFAVVYLVALFIVAPYTTCEPPTAPRYILPIYVPATMTAAVWLERFLSNTYQDSGISVWKSSDNWGINYLKSSGPMMAIRWITMGLIFIIFLASIFRNIVLYIDILTTYNPRGYQF